MIGLEMFGCRGLCTKPDPEWNVNEGSEERIKGHLLLVRRDVLILWL